MGDCLTVQHTFTSGRDALPAPVMFVLISTCCSQWNMSGGEVSRVLNVPDCFCLFSCDPDFFCEKNLVWSLPVTKNETQGPKSHE